MPLSLTPLTQFPIIEVGDDLAVRILDAVRRNGIELIEGDVLVIAQKIVSKAENRFVDLQAVEPSGQAYQLAKEIQKDPRLVELILRESVEILRKRPGTVIVEHRLGFVCANAGIDHSNVRGDLGEDRDIVLLLPEAPEDSASRLRARIGSKVGVDIGVAIIDSHGRAWRLGTVGVTIGISGLPGIIDMRGKQDLFGYRLQNTIIGAADELAAAASLVMGQADEATPVVHVRGFPYGIREGSLADIIRPKDEDLFR